MKKSQGGFIVPLLIIIIGVLVIGGGIYYYQKNINSNLSVITIRDSGSTNTGGFEITINPNGSGMKNFKGDRNVPAYIHQFPPQTLDYQSLKVSLDKVPHLPFCMLTSASVSFGTSEIIMYGKASGDTVCPPDNEITNDQVAQVKKAANDIMTQADCFNNDSVSCKIYNAQKTQGADSGIRGGVTVSPIPGCVQSPNLKSGENHPCALEPFSAKFKITKTDGSEVTEVSTDEHSEFYAILSAGNYILTDLSAGSSTQSHKFYDANSNKVNANDPNRWVNSYPFTVYPDKYSYIYPWFDGNSF